MLCGNWLHREGKREDTGRAKEDGGMIYCDETIMNGFDTIDTWGRKGERERERDDSSLAEIKQQSDIYEIYECEIVRESNGIGAEK